MESLSLVLLLAAGVLLWLWQRAIGRAVRAEPESPSAQRRPSYHAVEIRAPDAGCEAVRAVRGKRFLSIEAPPIPLPACGCNNCACYYVHHDDRRSGQRRNTRSETVYAGDGRFTERRFGVGRRASDRILFGSGR